MVVTNFISVSSASLEALKTANLLKGLPINAFIFGQNGTGKKSLAKYILPDAPIVDASLHDELEGALNSHKNVIITNFDKIPNYDNFQILLDKYEVRIMALASSVFNTELIEKFFGIKVCLPPLSERVEDVKPLCDYFLDEAKEALSVDSTVKIDMKNIDLSQNAHSIRRHVYMQVQLQDINENELMSIMQSFLLERLGGNNDYRNFLYLFEAPLIKAGLQKFKTQLQLSDKLGLNRNTLRKKIAENKEYLKDD
ncbi:MAG: Fis family transcriptional regulator [Arcobacter sp.]|nr:MAG: Fis family transcriptional regulator [Arcobacter sp.]